MIITRKLPNNKEFVLNLVQQNGCELEFASIKLQSDKDVVMTAIQQNGRALEFASRELQHDKDVVMSAIKQNGCALEFAPIVLHGDKNFVSIAVQQNGCALEFALEFASEIIRNNKEFVLVAVRQNDCALEFASREIQNDDLFDKNNLHRNGIAVSWTHNPIIAIHELKQDGNKFSYVMYNMNGDKICGTCSTNYTIGEFAKMVADKINKKYVILIQNNEHISPLNWFQPLGMYVTNIDKNNLSKNGIAIIGTAHPVITIDYLKQDGNTFSYVLYKMNGDKLEGSCCEIYTIGEFAKIVADIINCERVYLVTHNLETICYSDWSLPLWDYVT